MSTVSVTYNLSSKKWTGKTEFLSSNGCQLQIGFTSKDDIIAFDNLKFGYDIRTNTNVVHSNSFPEDPSISYKATNAEYLVSDFISLEPNTKYTIKLWAENGKDKTTFQYKIETPDNTDLGHYPESSVPHPNNNRHDLYKFDVSTRSWVKK